MAVLVPSFLGRQRCLKALEQGVHGRVAALLMGSGAVSRRQSIKSVRGFGAVTFLGSSEVPRREILFWPSQNGLGNEATNTLSGVARLFLF